jgi:hypothetical protein
LRTVLITLFVLGLLSACADLHREEQLKKVDKMLIQADSLQAVLQEHQVDTLANIQNSIMSIELRIRNNYTADTINISLSQKMNKFRNLKKFFMSESAEEEEEEEGEEKSGRLTHQTLGSAYLDIKGGIASEKSTLQELRSDISNGLGKRDKYNEYIAFETQKIDQLCELLEDYKTHKDKILHDFEDVYEDLSVFATKLETEKELKIKR